MIRKVIKIIIRYIKRSKIRKGKANLYKKIINEKQYLLKPVEGEKEWLFKWRKIDDKVTPYSFRIFSHYIGNDINIIPLETCATHIEPVLTPSEYTNLYNDKNLLDKLFSKDLLPLNLLRNISGNFYDDRYEAIDIEQGPLVKLLKGYNKVIVKPSLDAGGKGVKLFIKKDNEYKDKANNILSVEFLDKEYKQDYVIQKCLDQSPFTAFFNSSSVNTIRVVTYRSVKTGKIVVLNSIFRIGQKGANVDNASSGGSYCGISPDGVLGKYVCDWLGNTCETFNDIDFKNNRFIIPNYEIVKEFAIEVAKGVFYHNLLATDIMLDENSNPKLIEINSKWFSAWLFQFTNGSAFGKYTDEVLEYCSKRIKNVYPNIVL